jgi:hypothetical protein
LNGLVSGEFGVDRSLSYQESDHCKQDGYTCA